MPDDVRDRAREPPAVRGAAVVGRPDDATRRDARGDGRAARHAATTEELVDYLRNRLARYEIPTDIADRRRHPADAVRQGGSRARSEQHFADAPSPWTTMPADVRPSTESSRAVARGDHTAAGLRRRSAQLRRGRAPFGALARGLDRARRGQGQPRRHALPERRGVRRRHAGGSPDRRGRRCRSPRSPPHAKSANNWWTATSRSCSPRRPTARTTTSPGERSPRRPTRSANRTRCSDRPYRSCATWCSTRRIAEAGERSTETCCAPSKPTSTRRIPWRSSTPRGRRARRRAPCTPTPRCSITSTTSTRSAG